MVASVPVSCRVRVRGGAGHRPHAPGGYRAAQHRPYSCTHQVGTVQRSTGLTAARTRLVPCSAAQALQLHAPGGYRACGGARATLLRPHSPGANLVSETHTKCRSAQGAAVLPAHPLRCPGAIKPPYSASVPSGRRGGGWAVAVLSHCCCRCGPGMGVGAVLQLRGAAQ